MTNTEKEELNAKLDNEGFDYGFTCYSSFEEIKDEEFHRLRSQYLESRKALQEYIGFDFDE